MSDAFREKYGSPEERRDRIRSFCESSLAEVSEEARTRGFTLEIGCGHGHWLAAYAEANPQEACIGLDLMTKRIEKAENKRRKRNLSSLFFFKTEAVEFLEAMPEELRFRRIVVLFPDPWPKKRHFKRRLVQPAFLDLLRTRSRPEAELCFRTDYGPYFDWAVERVEDHDLWNLRDEAPWPFEHETFFQNILPEHQSFVATTSH